MHKGIYKLFLIILLLWVVVVPSFASENADVNWTPYVTELQSNIKANWHPPKRKTSVRTTVLFTVSNNGNLKNIRVFKSSGDENIDNISIRTIQNTAPFKPFPSNAQLEDIDIHFTFDYNVWTKKKKKIFSNYKKQITKEINQSLKPFSRYPKRKEVFIKINIVSGEYAKISNVEIVKSSGSEIFDEAILAALRGEKVFLSPMPKELDAKELNLDMIVSTKYSKKQKLKGSIFGGIIGALSGFLLF